MYIKQKDSNDFYGRARLGNINNNLMFYIKLKLQCKLSVDTIFRQNMIMFLTSYDSNLVAILYKWANHYHVFMVRESCFFFFSVELCCRNYISFVCLICHEQELIECQLYVSFFLNK